MTRYCKSIRSVTLVTAPTLRSSSDHRRQDFGRPGERAERVPSEAKEQNGLSPALIRGLIMLHKHPAGLTTLALCVSTMKILN